MMLGRHLEGENFLGDSVICDSLTVQHHTAHPGLQQLGNICCQVWVLASVVLTVPAATQGAKFVTGKLHAHMIEAYECVHGDTVVSLLSKQSANPERSVQDTAVAGSWQSCPQHESC